MRKQTKIAAVASAAALLAIGASMTAFAEIPGWNNEDGTWYYYDKDGNRVEDVWKSSNGQWYWLSSDEGGAMAVGTLVEDDDDTYYVDETGAMVRNQWVSIVNEDQDDDDDPAEYNWYYFQTNGKAYKGNGSSVSKKTIDGKRYAFDEDGKMLYGWVTDSGELANGEDDWADALYYFGDWSDGSMKTGWQQIYVHDDTKDDEYNYWFNFKSNGQKRIHDATDKVWKTNGKNYHFDERGVMVSQWFEATNSTSTTANWRYFNDPEDGARQTKGWFKVVPPTDDNTFIENGSGTFATSDSNDESERWYYADGNGELYVGEIKSIKGKYYAFWPDDGAKAGRMLSGLCALVVDSDGTIKEVVDDEVDSDDLDDILDGNTILPDGATLYYFGNDADHDGAMKTGSVTVSLDGNSYSFYFKKNGSVASGRGRGVSGIDDNKYIYMYGCRIKADSDDKYQLVEVVANGGQTNINAEGVKVSKVDAPKFTNKYTNKDDDTVNYVIMDQGYYLVNTSGNIQKNKNAAKDGNECYYYVNRNKLVYLYTDNKVLRTKGEGVSGNDGEDLAGDPYAAASEE